MIQFIKTRDVKDPVRDVTNAGIDCFVPNFSERFVADLMLKSPNFMRCANYEEAMQAAMQRKSFFLDETMYIAPHEDVIIPSGIHSKFGPELALIANNKSGIATKRKLVFGASVIDSNYEGEWHFNMQNLSNNYQQVSCGDKIIQFIPHMISTDGVEVLDQTKEEFYADSTSTRGDGWAGSTGTR